MKNILSIQFLLGIILIIAFTSCSSIVKNEEIDSTNTTEILNNDFGNTKTVAQYSLVIRKEKTSVKVEAFRDTENGKRKYLKVNNLHLNNQKIEPLVYSEELNSFQSEIEGVIKDYKFEFTDENGKSYQHEFHIDPIYFDVKEETELSHSKKHLLPLSRKPTKEELELWIYLEQGSDFEDKTKGKLKIYEDEIHYREGAPEDAVLNKEKTAVVISPNSFIKLWFGRKIIGLFAKNSLKKVEDEFSIGELSYRSELLVEVTK